MTLNQFINKYVGKTVGYPSGRYVGECLSIVKWYIKEVFNVDPPPSGCGSAKCYWTIFPYPLETIFKKVKYEYGVIPKPGSIAVWSEMPGNQHGHIGIVNSAEKNFFYSFDQNWGGRHAHIVRHDYNFVYGFLEPLKTNNENDTLNNMSDKTDRFYQNFMSAFRKHRDSIDWGADKDKIESHILEDDAMIGRVFDSISRQIEQLKKELYIAKSSDNSNSSSHHSTLPNLDNNFYIDAYIVKRKN